MAALVAFDLPQAPSSVTTLSSHERGTPMTEQPKRFTVETDDTGWSDIKGPNGYREGPYRYRWEAEEFAEKLERGLIAALGEHASKKG
jgi:hypothetical protein